MTNKQLQRKSTKWLQVLEDRSNINYLTVIDEQFAGNAILTNKDCHLGIKLNPMFINLVQKDECQLEILV